MPPPINAQSLQKEGRIQLAIQALDQGQICSIRKAARINDVFYETLHSRRAGIASRRDISPNSIKLLTSEEESIVEYIFELDFQESASPLNAVREMANILIAARHRDSVGKNWSKNILKRSPKLRLQ